MTSPFLPPSGTPGGLLDTEALIEMLGHAQEVDWRQADDLTLLYELLTQAGAEVSRLRKVVQAVQGETLPGSPAARVRFVCLTHFTIAAHELAERRALAQRLANPAAASAFDAAFQIVTKLRADLRTVPVPQEDS